MASGGRSRARAGGVSGQWPFPAWAPRCRVFPRCFPGGGRPGGSRIRAGSRVCRCQLARRRPHSFGANPGGRQLPERRGRDLPRLPAASSVTPLARPNCPARGRRPAECAGKLRSPRPSRGCRWRHPLLLVALRHGQDHLAVDPGPPSRPLLKRTLESAPSSPHRLCLEFRPVLPIADHTASAAALVGGGVNPRPGQSRWRTGCMLFLDELPEFARTGSLSPGAAGNGAITIARSLRTVEYPSEFSWWRQ